MRQKWVWSLGAILSGACAAPGFTQTPSQFQAIEGRDADRQGPVINRRVPGTGARLTLYQGDLALIEEDRVATIPNSAGNLIRLHVQDLPIPIVTGSQRLTHPSGKTPWHIETQAHVTPEINPQTLLEAFVGASVEIHVPAKDGQPPVVLHPTLISSQGEGIFELDGKVLLKPTGQVVLPHLPPHLAGRSTLIWTVTGMPAGVNPLKLSYLTQRLGWQCEHTVQVTPRGDASWRSVVNLSNASGIDFMKAQLTLIAGSPRQAIVPQPLIEMGAAPVPASRSDAIETMSPTMGYQRFDLPDPVDLPNHRTNQVRVGEFSHVQLKRQFVLDAQRTGDQDTPAAIQWHGRNSRETGLGVPLPAGIVHLEGAEDPTRRQWLGDDTIPHLATDQTIRLHQGWASDLRGKRSITQTQRPDARTRAETILVNLSNASADAAVIRVVEHPYGDWTLESPSHPPNPRDGQELSFDVPVNAHSQARLTFTLRYRE